MKELYNFAHDSVDSHSFVYESDSKIDDLYAILTPIRDLGYRICAACLKLD